MPDLQIVRTRESSNLNSYLKPWKVTLYSGDEEVPRLWVAVAPMRIGSATVIFGGIGGVGTPEKHRIDGTSVSVARTSSRGSLRVKIPQMRLTQWIMGYRNVEDVAYEVDVQVPRRARDVLAALFPVGAAYMWWSDRL